MEKKYLMGQGDQLSRKTILSEEYTSMNDSLKKELIKLGIKNTVNDFSKFNETHVIKALEQNLLDISKYRNCWNY